MFALILKDLRIFTNSRKYRNILFILMSILVLLFFVGTLEYYAQGTDTQRDGRPIDVGKQTYTLFILCTFFVQFFVTRQAVDSFYMEQSKFSGQNSLQQNGGNRGLLVLTPLSNWRILLGKLTSVVIWSGWVIWFTIPLFLLSVFIGGLEIGVLLKCGVVIVMSSILFTLIGLCFATFHSVTHAKIFSYGIVFALTFLPLLPIAPFANLPMLSIMSPLSALVSILKTDPTSLWLWNISLNYVFCVLLFPVVTHRLD